MNYEFLRPDELRKLQTASPLAFLPFGPLEWHGPHLPIGTDGLIAQAVAQPLSEQLGGVLLPTLFAGGAAPLGIPMCRTFGLPDSKKDAVGMDFAPNAFPSIYLKEPTLEALLNDYVDGLVAQGYRLIGLMEGRGIHRCLSASVRAAMPLLKLSGILLCCHFRKMIRTVGMQL